MFGYVKAYKPELKISEYDTYKAVYCTLCKVLGKDYGILARMTLSYDATFLSLIRLGLQEECCGYTTMRCTFNPLKKCNRLKSISEEMNYTAAVVIVLFYCKLLDNIIDSGMGARIKYYPIKPIFKRYYKKAIKRYPFLEQYTSDLMSSQAAVEKSGCTGLDMASHPTALLLQKVFARENDSDKVKRAMEQAGYCVGKWIYITDALDDLEDDLKHDSFNVLVKKYDLSAHPDRIPDARKNAVELLNACNDRLALSFELLPMHRYKGIVDNIIYMGMKNTVDNLGKKMKDTEEKR